MFRELQKARLAATIKAIADICRDDEKAFDEVLKLIANPDPKLAAKAAWVISHLCDKNPEKMGAEEQKFLLSVVNKLSPAPLKRNAMRIWQTVQIPEDLVPLVAGLAFSLLEDPKEDVAVRAFAISVLENCMKTIPELREEVLFLLEKELPHGTAAIQVRINRFIRNTR